jgi:hypothetical protein
MNEGGIFTDIKASPIPLYEPSEFLGLAHAVELIVSFSQDICGGASEANNLPVTA